MPPRETARVLYELVWYTSEVDFNQLAESRTQSGWRVHYVSIDQPPTGVWVMWVLNA